MTYAETIRRILLLPTAILLSSFPAHAAELIVPTDHATIQAAINAANAGDSVLVEPGTYAGPITLKNNIPLRGRETARTILTGGATGTAIIANGTTGITLKNFTLRNATTGIDCTNCDGIVSGNVFNLGTANAARALRVQNTVASSLQIVNNTFYQNATAVATNVTVTVKNNIFYGNTTNVNLGLPAASFTYNAFSDADPGSLDPSNLFSIDPLFVSTAALDFHLKEGSPCIDAGDAGITDSVDGTASDMGAYGGSSADSIPFPVTVAIPTVSGAGPYTITVTWSQNLSYLVTNTDALKRGGYKVYYRLNTSGPPYSGTVVDTGISEGNSPLIAGYTTSQTLSGLVGAATPAAPAITAVAYTDQMLTVTWTAVPGATSYTLYYIDNDAAIPTEQSVPVGMTTSYDLGGLVNLHRYSLAVTASTQNTLHLAVTSYDSTALTRDPGVQHESAYVDKKAVPYGAVVEGSKVYAPGTYFPEPILSSPNLPNKGCFIATAAYDDPHAWQVEVLRAFRDRYLEASAPGKVFIGWYYEHGPRAAHFLNEHPELKPLVQAALLPAVGVAALLSGTTPVAQWMWSIVLTVGGCSVLVLWFRSRRAGGRP